MNGHDEEKEGNHKCDTYEYQTKHRDQLVEHIGMSHTNQTELTCNLCKLKFRNKLQLNAHMVSKHRRTYKPCRNFPNCEYDSECSFYHIVLKQGEHICYKCADVFNNKTLLLKHIASVNGEEPCQKFKANKCTIGNTCFFKHVETNVQVQHQIQHLHQLSHSRFF